MVSKAYLESEEVDRLEKAASNLRDRLMVRLLGRTGCTVSEVLGIAVDDFDLAKGTVNIERVKLRVRLFCAGCKSRLSKTSRFCPQCGLRAEAVSDHKEEYRARTLPLDSDTIDLLHEFVQRKGPVFRNGRQLLFGLSRVRAWQIIRDCAERAKLPNMVDRSSGMVHGIGPRQIRSAFTVKAAKCDNSASGLRMLRQHLGRAGIVGNMRCVELSGKEHRQWCEQLWQKGKDGD